MKTKVLFCALALLAVMVLASRPIGTAEAWGRGVTVETFVKTPFSDPSTFTNMEQLESGSENYACDGTIRVAHGTLRKYDYSGPLGTGTFYLDTLVSITEEAIPNSNLIGNGGGIYKYTLVIDDGLYGTGTLKGIAKLKWDFDLPAYKYEQWDNGKMVPVEGYLNIRWVSVEGYMFLFNWWWTTTTIVS
jgi:hypothetical protein